MDEKTKRLVNWAHGKPQPPMAIELIPTNRCNFKCKSCWRWGADESQFTDEMSDERLLKLIDEAAEMGVREFAFVGGGEPLSREITFELFKKIKKYGMDGDLVTNGSLLTEEMLQTLVDIGWTRVKFSIDGSEAKIQDKLRGIKCFEKIKKNMVRLNQIKKQKGKKFPRICFNTVVSNMNYKDLPNIIELAHEVGCNELLILPLTVFSEEGKSLKLSAKQLVEFQEVVRKKCLPKLKKYEIYSNLEKFLDVRLMDKTDSMDDILMEEAEKASLRAKIEEKGEDNILKEAYKKHKDPVKDFKTLPCFDPWHHITILPNGNIAPCFNNYVWETKTTIVKNNLKDLWYGSYFEKYRDIIKTRKLPPACKTCCVWKVFENEKVRNQMDDYEKKNKQSLKNKAKKVLNKIRKQTA